VFTLTGALLRSAQGEESKKDDVELFKPGEHVAETFQSAEQPFDFIALPMKSAVVFPRMDSVGLRPNHRNHAQVEEQLPYLIALVSSIP
jgi:hypothetical protein